MKKTLTIFSGFCGFCLLVLGVYTIGANDITPNARVNVAYGATGASGTGSFNNHTLFAGAAPVISNCGISPTITTASGDNAGSVKIGAAAHNALGQIVPVLQCTITWTTAFTSAPSISIVMGDNTTRKYGVGNINASIASNSTTVTIFNFDTDAANATFTYTAF